MYTDEAVQEEIRKVLLDLAEEFEKDALRARSAATHKNIKYRLLERGFEVGCKAAAAKARRAANESI